MCCGNKHKAVNVRLQSEFKSKQKTSWDYQSCWLLRLSLCRRNISFKSVRALCSSWAAIRLRWLVSSLKGKRKKRSNECDTKSMPQQGVQLIENGRKKDWNKNVPLWLLSIRNLQLFVFFSDNFQVFIMFHHDFHLHHVNHEKRDEQLRPSQRRFENSSK